MALQTGFGPLFKFQARILTSSVAFLSLFIPIVSIFINRYVHTIKFRALTHVTNEKIKFSVKGDGKQTSNLPFIGSL